jgi:hypothetical protein
MDKDKVLAFIMRNQAAGEGEGKVLAIEASKQVAMTKLFDTMAKQLAESEAILESVSWSASADSTSDLQKIENVLSSLTTYQARYLRTLEASESLTAALEKKV